MSVRVHWDDPYCTLYLGNALEVAQQLPDGAADCIVTSPPYFGLRDYGTGEDQYGLEDTPDEYAENMRALFSELRRVLADDGVLWLNLGDTYSGSGKGIGSRNGKENWVPPEVKESIPTAGKNFGLQPKNLLGVPWRVAFALQADGWILRNEIIWNKPNGLPEPVKDRLTGKHEHIFLFSKSRKYWFDLTPIRVEHKTFKEVRWEDRKAAGEPIRKGLGGHTGGDRGYHKDGKNPGDVWDINTESFPGAHFAVFPHELARRCIVSGCKPGGTVLDPFSGSATTGAVALDNGRKYIGIDNNRDYLNLSLRTRLRDIPLPFDQGALK